LWTIRYEFRASFLLFLVAVVLKAVPHKSRALIYGALDVNRPVLVRVHVQGMLCDLLGARTGDCGWPLRHALEDRGIFLGGSYTMDLLGNPVGGKSAGFTYFGQVQVLLQIIRGLFANDAGLAELLDRPRWRSENGRLLIERDHPEAAALAGIGHDLVPLPEGDMRFGGVVAAGLDRGVPIAGADWRRETWAAVT
jgi:hypothetical protein